MTGQLGGAMKNLCDVIIMAPSVETYRIQEYHLPIYHTLCAMVEAEIFVY
jgi:D-sedoheptulose 7-phosphate isomerase